MLKELLDDSGVSQAELARGIDKTEPYISRLVRGDVGASQDTINAILAFLAARLGRPVTYEETFGAPTVVEVPEPASAEAAQ